MFSVCVCVGGGVGGGVGGCVSVGGCNILIVCYVIYFMVTTIFKVLFVEMYVNVFFCVCFFVQLSEFNSG